MGYYSDIYVRTSVSKLLEVTEMLEDADLLATVKPSFKIADTYIQFIIPSIKWYHSFPAIDKLTTALADLCNTEHAAYILVGEDIDDVESFGLTYKYDLNVITTVEGF